MSQKHPIETRKVPCCIKEGNNCTEPFCRMKYFELLAERFYQEWIEKCKKELEEYKKRIELQAERKK